METEMEMEMEVAVETAAMVNDENSEKWWRRWEQWGKRKIIGTDGEGTVSDDLNGSGNVCGVFLI
jgi:hypothetical protein